MGFPLKDGSGPAPDSRKELVAWIGIGLVVALTFGVFTGLDAQVNYIISAPGDYFALSAVSTSDSVYFEQDQIDLMNEVSARSIGPDAVAAERLYCGEIRNSRVTRFRLADVIKDSSLTSVSGSCTSPVDIWVHSQPDGSSQLSEEDKDLESDPVFTCVQYAEISVSPVTKRLHGIKCFSVGNGFKEVPVYLQN